MIQNNSNSIIATDKTQLGANYNPDMKTVDFKLASLNATDVILCIFDEAVGKDPIMNLNMIKNNETGLWETSVKTYVLFDLKKPFYYGYRVFGPNWVKKDDYTAGSDIGFINIVDENNNRFNPNKLAYDPYTRELSHLPSLTNTYLVNENNYTEDNAKTAPKSVFTYLNDVLIPKAPISSLKDEIIGEVHIKDLTECFNFEEKGTYKGASKFAKAIKQMGFTMVEFLPLNEFDDYDNYWGYMPLTYFSLTKKYAFDEVAGSALVEFRSLIKAFHENGLKVAMDVVYNHTGEGKINGYNKNEANLMSYALVDNQTYYKNTPNNFYVANSFCHNDFNVANKITKDLILDSIEYWVRQGVDAFRLDLAAALMDVSCGHTCCFDKHNSLIGTLKKDLSLRGINVLEPDETGDGIYLIAEPWTCSGENCYQLGNFPSYFGEWNDVCRDTIRANSIKPESTDLMGLKNLIEGTPFAFGTSLKPINYVSCHDGFSLNDLNSYDKPSPSTSGGNQYELCSSYNGDVSRQIVEMKKQIALLMLSKGTPMMQIGDIVAHTKFGNNNSYNKDDKTNYIDFKNINDITTKEGRIFDFVSGMIEFRKNHKIISSKNYNELIEYMDKDAVLVDADNKDYWYNPQTPFFGFKTTNDDVFYFALSKSENELEIALPKNSVGKNWHKVFDVSDIRQFQIQGEVYNFEKYKLLPYSCALFIEK